jgi:hypothetical protein
MPTECRQSLVVRVLSVPALSDLPWCECVCERESVCVCVYERVFCTCARSPFAPWWKNYY